MEPPLLTPLERAVLATTPRWSPTPMNASRFPRIASPILLALAVVGCSDDSTSSCSDDPSPPSFSVATFNADTIKLDISRATNCPIESVDTGHVAMRLEGHVQSMDGSIDSIWFQYITPGWILEGARPKMLLWTTPKDGIAHLRGVKVNLVVASKESGRLVTFEARQDPATY